MLKCVAEGEKPMNESAKIMIVDDDPGIRTVVRLLLEAKGYEVVEASSGYEAVEAIAGGLLPDLIILDIMMPGMSGTDACASLRKLTNAPVLFLTAKTQEQDKLQAYSTGGDDFLGKPFSQAELLAKVQSLLRRYIVYKGKNPADGKFEFDRRNRAIMKNGETIELTDLEMSILDYLLKRKGSAVSVRELYENVWGEKFLSSSTNTVMVHILNLRKKVEDDAANPKIIRTVWGKGYQIDE
jgi:two-component system OmpR family response regulator